MLTLPEVVERGAFRLEKLYVPDHRLVTGRAAGGDSYLRHVMRRTNWSRQWCPGTYYYDQWEDAGEVGGAQPEPGPQRCLYACVWNASICIGVKCSIYVEPLVTSLDAAGAVLDGRAGEFSIWAGTSSTACAASRRGPSSCASASWATTTATARWIGATPPRGRQTACPRRTPCTARR